MVATSLCPGDASLAWNLAPDYCRPNAVHMNIQNTKKKEKTKRKFKRSQDNDSSIRGAQTSSAYSFVLLAILLAAPFHRSSKWLAARCLLASRFLVFFLFGVFLARPFFPHFSPVDSKTVQRSALCRSRRELSNEYLLAKFGFDTAENEPI